MKASTPAAPGAAAVATGLIAFVGMGAASALYGPTLPVLSDRYGLDGATAGLVLAAHGAGAFIGVAACLMPQVEARMRFRPPFALCMIGLGAVMIAVGLPWPFPLLGAFSIGIGYGLLTVGFNGLFARGFGSRSAAMVNLLNAIFGIGSVCAPIVFVASGGSPAIAYGTVAALAFVLAPLAATVDDRSHTVPAARPDAGLASHATRRSALPMAVMFFAIGTEAAIVGWGPTILIARGAEPLEAARASSWFFAVFLIARLVAVPLAGYLAYRTLALAAIGIVLCCAVLAATTEQPALWYAAMGVIGIAFPNGFGWLSRLLHAVPGGDARIVVAALAGGTTIPLVLGLATAFVGEAALFVLLAATLAIAGAAGLMVPRMPDEGPSARH